MLDKFKEFIGIDDNYDDYDEDQLLYDSDSDESKETSKSSYSNFFSDKDYKMNDDDKSQTFESSYSNTYSNPKADNEYRMSRSKLRGDNVVNMSEKNYSSTGSMRISIQEPLDYEADAPKVVNDILNKKVVVLNLEMVEADTRRKIFDFVSGAVYALDGTVEKVTKGIFVITPKGVAIDSQVTEQITEGNYNQL